VQDVAAALRWTCCIAAPLLLLLLLGRWSCIVPAAAAVRLLLLLLLLLLGVAIRRCGPSVGAVVVGLLHRSNPRGATERD
jgi:hypothetical protein